MASLTKSIVCKVTVGDVTLVPDKAPRQEIITGGSRIVRFGQQLFRLAQATHDNIHDIKALKAEVAVLKQQVRDLQTREEVLLARAEAAAAGHVAQTTNDLARRIGQLEGRLDYGQ